MSVDLKQRHRDRMTNSNPMKNPEVAAKVGKHTRDNPIMKTAIWKQRIAASARKRMLSADNPMKDEKTARKVMTHNLDRTTPSKSELQFDQYAKENGIDVEFVGNGKVWLGRINPDFRIPGQKKAIETTEKTCFNNGLIERDADGYGLERITKSIARGWQCLVVFKGKHTSPMPKSLATVLHQYALFESQWSGVWYFDKLLTYDPAAVVLTELPQCG